MPYELRKTAKGWGAYNAEKREWRSRDTTREKAAAQIRLLNAIEHGDQPKAVTPAQRRRHRKAT